MSDRGAVALALACVLGVLASRPLPLLFGVAAGAGALLFRRPVLLVVGSGLLASTLGARAWAGLAPPTPRVVDRVVTLATDPKPVAGAVRVEMKLGRRRVEAWAHGSVAGSLHHRLAGERVRVRGSLRPLDDEARHRLAARHIAGRVNLSAVDFVSAGSLPARLANGMRRTLIAGAGSMSREHRSLFTGFVLGDDREQSDEVTNDFRASGLSHLLVVSGANVAFFLALAAPALRRMALRPRLVVGVMLLLFFGLLTRWEPSVIRAIAMAAITMVAATLGRPASAIRIVALAVAALLLIDPLLLRSVGFLLSLGACVGIVTLARPITARLRGPRPLAAAIGVTAAAQLGVAPVLVPVFGPVPVASLPANLLAVPAAAPIMVWGMTAGFVAGILPPALAALVHLPTRLLVAWVAFVARFAADLPLGRVGLAPLLMLAVAVALPSVRAACHRRAEL